MVGHGSALGVAAPAEPAVRGVRGTTSRYGLPLVSLQGPVSWQAIAVDSEANLGDMRDYLNRLVGTDDPDPALAHALVTGGVDPARFVGTLLDRCAGVWIYLRYVLEDIRTGRRLPSEVARLPDGLRGYYLEEVERWAQDASEWVSVRRPALATLAALRSPATPTDLASLMGGNGDPGKIQDFLDHGARPFLDVTRSPGGPLSTGERRYAIRHESLRDLFTTQPPGGGEHDAGLTFQLREALYRAHEAITSRLIPPGPPGQRDWSHVDTYTQVMLADHAEACGRLDGLARDPGFVLTCMPLLAYMSLEAWREHAHAQNE